MSKNELPKWIPIVGVVSFTLLPVSFLAAVWTESILFVKAFLTIGIVFTMLMLITKYYEQK